MQTRCCWCAGHFVKIGEHFWCETPACRQRQADHSLVFQDVRTKTADAFYVPTPKGVDFDAAKTPMLLGGGAAGSAKSTTARYGLYRRAFQIPGFEGLILRKTWGELEKHHLRLMEREAHRLKARGLPVEFSKTDREFRIRHGQDISVIEGGHMENPDDVEKYLSRERDAIVLDEGSTFPNPNDVLELSTRARSSKRLVAEFARKMLNLPANANVPRGGAVFWVLSNPGGPSAAMLKAFFIDHEPDFDDFPQLQGTDSEGKPMYNPAEWGYIPGNLEDNPYLPDSYERDLALTTPWRYQQLRYNNWDVVKGHFFTEFDQRVHVKDLGKLGGDVTWFRSMDYGYMDPNVTLWWAILPDGRLHIAREQKRQHCNIPQLAKDIHTDTRALGIPKVRYTVADKFSMGGRTNDDDGESRADTFRKWGIPTTSVSHDREQGWTRIRELLAVRPDGLPWLTMDPSCRYLIRAMSSAVSDKNNPEDIAGFKDDHPLDALRIGAMSRPSPGRLRAVDLPKNAVGHLLNEVRSSAHQVKHLWR